MSVEVRTLPVLQIRNWWRNLPNLGGERSRRQLERLPSRQHPLPLHRRLDQQHPDADIQTVDLEPSGEIRIRIDPAHDEAFMVMTRGSVDGPESMQGYDALFTYMRERGQTGMGCREIYFEDAPWDSLRPDQPAFDIALPFA